VFTNNLTELGEVWLPGLRITSIIVPKGTIRTSCKPKWKSTSISFGIDIRPWAKENIQSNIFGISQDWSEIMGSGGKVKDPWTRVVVTPMRVKLKGIETGGFDL